MQHMMGLYLPRLIFIQTADTVFVEWVLTVLDVSLLETSIVTPPPTRPLR